MGNDTADSLVVAEIAGDAAEGLRIINVPSAGEGQPFEQAFEAKFGKPQSSISWAAYAYDDANLLFQTIEEVGTSGAAIRDALYALTGYEGVIGNFHFDANGDVVGAGYVVKEFKDGVIVTIPDISLE